MNIRMILGKIWKLGSQLVNRSVRARATQTLVSSSLRQASRRTAPYAVGRSVVGIVRLVNETGVYLKMPDAADAVVSAASLRKVLGKGFVRRVKVGAAFRAVVKAYYPETRQLVAVADPMMAAKTSVVHHGVPKKPTYEVLPQGTTVLVDMANVFSTVSRACRLTPAESAVRFEGIVKSVGAALKAKGYVAFPMVERKTVDWCGHMLDEGGAALAGVRAELDAFLKSGELTVVNGREADLVLLQNARALPNSVVLTNDRFADYAEAFGGIVGTSRVRGFTCVNDAQGCRLSIEGLEDVLSVDVSDPLAYTAAEPETVEIVDLSPSRRERENLKAGLFGLGEVLLRKGRSAAAMACFRKAGEKGDVSAYRAMAEFYGREGEDKESRELARRYGILSDRLEKRHRMESRRAARRSAEKQRNPYRWLAAA